jgi:hypothetical protein
LAIVLVNEPGAASVTVTLDATYDGVLVNTIKLDASSGVILWRMDPICTVPNSNVYFFVLIGKACNCAEGEVCQDGQCVVSSAGIVSACFALLAGAVAVLL